jgi:DNA excision repair protein ERCC-2
LPVVALLGTSPVTSSSEKLRREFDSLVNGLQASAPEPREQGQGLGRSDAVSFLASPLLPDDVLQEAVPGSIRRAKHFITFLKSVVEYLKRQIKGINVEVSTPLAFLHEMQAATHLDRKPLQFAHSRLNSLLRTLEVSALEEFRALCDVANFVTLLATYFQGGFAVVMEPQGSMVAGVQEPLLQLSCLDAAIAIKPVLERFQTVVITSGTLSPLDLYPKLLGFHPVIKESLPMSTFRPCLLPLVVTKGADQTPISTRFTQRKEPSVVRNYGALLLEVCSIVPDGVCVFFTSYLFMEYMVSQWDDMGILKQVMEKKLVFLETKDVVETTLALDNFKSACDCGRGAVFLSVARGKVAEGVDFDRHYGRAVLMLGIPYQYTLSHVLKARLDFMRTAHGIKDNDFLSFDALRQTAQCIGRVIRSKTDYGLVYLADQRYNNTDRRAKLPPWVQQFLRLSSLGLSTDEAGELSRRFMRQMGQGVDQKALRSILMDEQEAKRHARKMLNRVMDATDMVAEVAAAATATAPSLVADRLAGAPMETD